MRIESLVALLIGIVVVAAIAVNVHALMAKVEIALKMIG